jgi:hypothetical protein
LEWRDARIRSRASQLEIYCACMSTRKKEIHPSTIFLLSGWHSTYVGTTEHASTDA